MSRRFSRAGEQLVDGRNLAGEAHAATDGVGLGEDVVTGDAAGAAGGHAQRGEHAHGGGLAGAVRPEQAEHGALRERRS